MNKLLNILKNPGVIAIIGLFSAVLVAFIYKSNNSEKPPVINNTNIYNTTIIQSGVSNNIIIKASPEPIK